MMIHVHVVLANMHVEVNQPLEIGSSFDDDLFSTVCPRSMP